MFHGLEPELAGAALLALLAAPAGAFLLLGSWRLLRGRWLRAGAELGVGILLLALAATLGLVALNLITYQRLTSEQDAGLISFTQVGPQRFEATLHLAQAPDRVLELAGDEWQIDARILKWKSPATLLGLDTRYRFERLAGRYRDVAAEREALRTVHDLGTPAGDLALLLDRTSRRLPWVDAYYGNSAYLPMEHGAAFRISVTTSGLAARPANGEAERAVQNWR